MITDSIRDFRKHATALVSYDILFKLFQIGIVSPLLVAAFAAVAYWGGGGSMSNGDILVFLLSPVGLVVIIASVAIALAMAMAEMAGLMLIYYLRRAGRSMSPLRALWIMVRRLPGLIGISAVQYLLWLLCVLPLGAVAAWIWFQFLDDYDIYYLWIAKPPVFLWSLAAAGSLIAGAMVLALLFYLPLVFALPFHVLARMPARAALKAGTHLARGAFRRLIWILSLWLIASIALTVASDFIIRALAELAMPLAGQSLAAVAAVLGVAVTLHFIALTVLSIFTLSVNSILVVRCYRRFGPAEVTRLPAPGAELSESQVRSYRKPVAIAAVAFLVVSIAASVVLVNSLQLEDEVVITAHRAGAVKAPENTLAAIEQAIVDGAHFAEIDVQETADGEIVVLHDTDLLRLAGVDRKVWEMAYDEICKLDVGSWFSDEFTGERVPTLREAIQTSRGRLKLNIELKPNGHEKALVESVVQTIREEQFESDCIVTSLDYGSVLRTKQLDPRIRVGYIVFETIGKLGKLDADIVSLNSRLATQAIVASVKKQDKEIHVWTVNDKVTMSELIDLGVDGIITDRPDLLAQVIEVRGEMSHAERLLLRFGLRPWE
jgi:glycerophosphoryl diester phosphodiesterase